MKKFKGLFVLFGVVITTQVLLSVAMLFYIPEPTNRGTFGDMFGGINTLFSGLAFAGVIYAIILQSKELSLQRRELKLTREELARSAEAQNEQAKALLDSAVINATASQLNMFTTLIVNARKLPKNRNHEEVGDGMQKCYEDLDLLIREIKKRNQTDKA